MGGREARREGVREGEARKRTEGREGDGDGDTENERNRHFEIYAERQG